MAVGEWYLCGSLDDVVILWFREWNGLKGDFVKAAVDDEARCVVFQDFDGCFEVNPVAGRWFFGVGVFH